MMILSEESRARSAGGLGSRGENLSILIPTYNCAKYLRLALQSLQAQDHAIAGAQIVIVDDASTRDDPCETADQTWPRRAEFIRQPKNVGLVANFNFCLSVADRPWVHILHGDDVALSGAYSEFDRAAAEFPAAPAIFGRSVFMNADGYWKGTTPILGPQARGLLEYRPINWTNCPVQFAGVLMNRQRALDIGGFDPSFTHAADWNLWWRLARTGRAAYSNQCVGGYRMFDGNHSSTLRRSGLNLREGIEQIRLVSADVSEDHSGREIWKPMVDSIVRQCQSFAGDGQAYADNLALLDLLPAGAVPWKTRSMLKRKQPRHSGPVRSKAA
jgi:glycosyltransferase involved in cell wall biosynthesis